MTLSKRIAPHIPYLRRFARATTGSQTSGDAYVAATLEALIADVSIFPEASNDRIALYRLVSALFFSSAAPTPEHAPTPPDQDSPALLSQASLKISKRVATEILIIEDEPLIAMDIEQLVESLG